GGHRVSRAVRTNLSSGPADPGGRAVGRVGETELKALSHEFVSLIPHYSLGGSAHRRQRDGAAPAHDAVHLSRDLPGAAVLSPDRVYPSVDLRELHVRARRAPPSLR